MGQKVNPTGFRIGLYHEWTSKWYADKKDFANFLAEDLKIRKYFANKYNDAGVADIFIERNAKAVKVTVMTSRPGVVAGRSGDGATKIEKDLNKLTRKNITLDIQEIAKPDLDAVVLAEMVSRQLEKRMPFRRVAKQAVQKAMEAGAKGVKVAVTGRLGGAEIARGEFFAEGTVPLHTLRSKISFAMDRGETTYGTLGVKVWVYTGDRFKKMKKSEEQDAPVAEVQA